LSLIKIQEASDTILDSLATGNYLGKSKNKEILASFLSELPSKGFKMVALIMVARRLRDNGFVLYSFIVIMSSGNRNSFLFLLQRIFLCRFCTMPFENVSELSYQVCQLIAARS
jgi:hypothetical protein